MSETPVEVVEHPGLGPTVRRRATLSLLRVELARGTRSPVLLVACGLSGWLMWAGWWDGRHPKMQFGAQIYWGLRVAGVVIMLAGFLLGCFSMARERGDTTQELFDAAPVNRRRRAVVALVAGAAPVTVAAILLVAVQAALVARAGGVIIGMPPHSARIFPTVGEWAAVPAATLAAAAAGAAVYAWVRSRVLTVLVGCCVSTFTTYLFWLWMWQPVALVSPFGDPLPAHTNLDRRSVGRPLEPAEPGGVWAWLEQDPLLNTGHAIYLVGTAVLFATAALARTAPGGRNRSLLATGAAFAAIGVSLQIVARAE